MRAARPRTGGHKITVVLPVESSIHLATNVPGTRLQRKVGVLLLDHHRPKRLGLTKPPHEEVYRSLWLQRAPPPPCSHRERSTYKLHHLHVCTQQYWYPRQGSVSMQQSFLPLHFGGFFGFRAKNKKRSNTKKQNSKARLKVPIRWNILDEQEVFYSKATVRKVHVASDFEVDEIVVECCDVSSRLGRPSVTYCRVVKVVSVPTNN